MSARSRCPIRGSRSWRGLAKSAQIVPTRLTFVDIAGLVRGASKGEGLGNQFLANIREVDAIAHVVRCFEDTDVTHVEGRIDPVADIETVETELMLADLDSLERRVDALDQEGQGRRQGSQGSARPHQPRAGAVARGQAGAAHRAQAGRGAGLSHARAADRRSRCSMSAMSRKPRPRRAMRSRRQVEARAKAGRRRRRSSSRPRSNPRSPCCRATSATSISAAVGLEEAGLDRLIRAGYALLHLVTFFTVGPKEARAWTITRGTKAPQAAGVIHTDFEQRLHPRRDHRL